MYREARIRFVRPVQAETVTFEHEMDLLVALEHGWVSVELEVDGQTQRFSLPASCVEWIQWHGPGNYGPTVSRGGI